MYVNLKVQLEFLVLFLNDLLSAPGWTKLWWLLELWKRRHLTASYREEDGVSSQTGAAVASLSLQQLAAVEAAVVQLQLLQAQVVGDAGRARGGRQADPLRWELGGGGAAAMLRVVQHLRSRVASSPLQDHPLHGPAPVLRQGTGDVSGASDARLHQIYLHRPASITWTDGRTDGRTHRGRDGGILTTCRANKSADQRQLSKELIYCK